jgi:hypothetical protein
MNSYENRDVLAALIGNLGHFKSGSEVEQSRYLT